MTNDMTNDMTFGFSIPPTPPYTTVPNSQILVPVSEASTWMLESLSPKWHDFFEVLPLADITGKYICRRLDRPHSDDEEQFMETFWLALQATAQD